MAGILFCLAGLIWVISSLISGQIVPHIPIGMAMICVGLALSGSSRRK